MKTSSTVTVPPYRPTLRAVLYFLAAGAAGFGGPAAAAFLFHRGQQEAAASTLARDIELTAGLLQTRTKLARLRDEALAAGVDPDQVEHAYRELRDRPATTDEVIDRLRNLGGP